MVAGIYRDAKRRVIYIALWTEPEGDSCFSIFQISWIKIKKKLFVNKRHHLVSSGGSRGGARGARRLLLFSDQTEARRAKKFFGDHLPLISGSGWPPPCYLKIWNQHWLEFVYVAIDSVSRIILYDSVANSVRIKCFFYRPVNGDKPNFVPLFGICWSSCFIFR